MVNNIITLIGINVSGGHVPTLNIIENVTIGSIVNIKGPNTVDLDISNVLTEISSPLFLGVRINCSLSNRFLYSKLLFNSCSLTA
jgi:hypothetical protein